MTAALRLLSYGRVDMALPVLHSGLRLLAHAAGCTLRSPAARQHAALRLGMTGWALYPMLLTAPQLPLLQPPL